MQTRWIAPALTIAAAFALSACSGSDELPDAGSPDSGAATCTTDDDCAADEHCDDATMVCVAGNGNACEMDSDCGDGRVCNTAVTDCGATRCRNVCEAASCTAHAECGTWVCIDGTCAEPPSCVAAVCPGDLVCNDMMVCAPPTTCTDDAECSGTDICAGGVCGAPISCTDSTSCPAGLVCQSGTCDDPCTADAECGDALMFTCETSTGLCRQRCLTGDGDCASGFICESLVCLPAQCMSDANCTGANEECQGEENGHGRCVVVTSCMDTSECPANFTCENMQCVELPACLGDRDCPANSFCEDRHCQPAEACNGGVCPNGFDCVGDLCVPRVCRGDADCPNPGEVCVAGNCLAAQPTTTVSEIRILTPAGTVRHTESYAFTAVAIDAAGDLIPGIAFDWTSSDTNVATIGADGVATALSLAGVTDIVASVDNGMMSIASAAVTLTVLDPVQAGFRVTVVDYGTGAAVSGATVVCNQESVTTDAGGVATFDATTPKTCTVFSTSHDYLTVAGLNGNDARLALMPPSRSDRSTGYTGMVDTTAITAPVRLSFSGGSFGSPLMGFAPANILGGDVFNFEVPVVGTVAFPSGATASAEIMGFALDLKSTYHAQGSAGVRRAWTFAGGAELADLGLTNGALLANILPLLQTFRHGGSTGLDTLVPLPLIVDSADIDGDADTTEMVPDYNAFVPKNLTPTQTQNLRMIIDGSTANLPTGANSMMVVSGALLPGVGFVPLGLDGVAEPNGAVGRFSTAMAPPYAGLEYGEYAVLVAAVNIVADELPQVASAKVLVAGTLPTEMPLGSSWLAFPNGSFVDGTRTLTVPSVTDADVWRAHFSSPTGGWQVYAANGTPDLALPAVPMGFDDRSAGASVRVQAVQLSSGTDLTALFGAGTDALHMDRVTVGFSQQQVR